MLIERPKQLKRLLECDYIIKPKLRASVELRRNQQSKQFDKKGMLAVLDPRKIKSRLSQLLKQQNQLKRAQSCLSQQQSSKKKAYREYFNKSFLKRKQKGESHHHLVKSKMEIINDEQSQQLNPLFNIKQIKIKRKCTPFDFSNQKKPNQESFSERYYRVLSFTKTRFNQKFYRKPLLPQAAKNSEAKILPNNFLRTKNKFRCGEQERQQIEPIQPWQKVQQIYNQQYDI